MFLPLQTSPMPAQKLVCTHAATQPRKSMIYFTNLLLIPTWCLQTELHVVVLWAVATMAVEKRMKLSHHPPTLTSPNSWCLRPFIQLVLKFAAIRNFGDELLHSNRHMTGWIQPRSYIPPLGVPWSPSLICRWFLSWLIAIASERCLFLHICARHLTLLRLCSVRKEQGLQHSIYYTMSDTKCPELPNSCQSGTL